MSTRNLDAIFRPKTIALVGASNREGAVGWAIARNLYAGGFAGPILAVSQHEPAIGSVLSYRSVAELPLAPDLAVLATPAAAAPALIAELGQRGCRAAIVVAAGLGEGEERAGSDLRQAMLDAARPHMLRIMGPNCLGFLSPAAGINASFAHLAPRPGDVAFVAQSGALVTAVLDWAVGRNLGFSHIASLGDMADVDFGDMLDWLALDTATRSILLYVESVTQARKFMSAARIAARAKPVIVIKSGRSAAGAKAALSHTGALAGSDAVYDAAFRRAGMLRVESLHELFEAAETLASRLTVRGDRLAILTNGGGAGVLATDALEALGGRLAELAPDVRAKLDGVLPAAWSHGVPVDILGDADGDRYAAALSALEANPDQDAILVMNCPTAVVDNARVADAVVTAAAASRHRPLLTCWLGEATASAARRRFATAGVPTYETPDDAVRAFMQLDRYRRNQALLMETPPAGPEIDGNGRARSRAQVETALAAGRSVLTEPEAKALLAAYGVPIVASDTAASPREAAQAAVKIGFPVVLKILSPDISHKSDVGGVRLGLGSAEAVEGAATAMLTAVAASAPGAAIEGFTVESMIERPQARELICGIVEDATFGPTILVGQGGVAVEVVGDRALGLPPLNAILARDMIRRTRVAKLLDAYRNVPAVDHAALEDVLVRLSAIAVDLPEVVELDINPLLADAAGMLAARRPRRLKGGRRRCAVDPGDPALSERARSHDHAGARRGFPAAAGAPRRRAGADRALRPLRARRPSPALLWRDDRALAAARRPPLANRLRPRNGVAGDSGRAGRHLDGRGRGPPLRRSRPGRGRVRDHRAQRPEAPWARPSAHGRDHRLRAIARLCAPVRPGAGRKHDHAGPRPPARRDGQPRSRRLRALARGLRSRKRRATASLTAENAEKHRERRASASSAPSSAFSAVKSRGPARAG